MWYIRFLKPPRVHDNSIKALITITTDLGETFLFETVTLSAFVRSDGSNGIVCMQENLKWSVGMRALSINFDIGKRKISWPARIHVAPQGASMIDDLSSSQGVSILPDIISVWSDILDPTKHLMSANKLAERRLLLSSYHELRIWEETGESIARHIWDAGLALSDYLDRKMALQASADHLASKSVVPTALSKVDAIELGSGCGIVGISLAQAMEDCNVLLTDLAEAQEIAQRNIGCANAAKRSALSFLELNWEDPLPPTVQGKRFDLIIIADCTYNPDSGPTLVKTLKSLIEKSPNALVLLSMKVRHQSELVFFSLMKEAGFLQHSQVTLPLPTFGGSSEEILVFVFCHTPAKLRNSRLAFLMD